MARLTRLDRDFHRKLEGSDITPNVAAALGLKTVSASAAPSLAPNIERRGGFVIPYFSPEGNPDPEHFFRFRYLDPPTGFGVNAKRPRRYTQPPNTAPRAYFPPLLPWMDISTDTKWSVIVTEGELKAACACRHGYPTIGLGGVSAYGSKRRGFEFLPELDRIAWEERKVYIAFDSDIRRKPQVRDALTRLSERFLERGAIPYEVVIPDLDDPDKTGLDDFIVARGGDAVAKLIADSIQYEASAALWRLSAEVVYVRDPGTIVQIESGQRHTPAAFREHAFSNRWYVERRLGKDGATERLAKKKAAVAWLDWPHRAEVERFTFLPGKDRITDENEFNLWRCWGIEAKRGTVEPWNTLLAHLFGGDRAKQEYFERWLAYPLQQPGAKLSVACLVWGLVQGTGKSLIGYTVGRIYGDGFGELQPSQLHEAFNDWSVNRQLIMVDEIKGEDRRADSELLKRLITQATVRVNEKFQAPFLIPDCINYYLTSNHPDALYLEPTDRRFFVHEVEAGPLPQAFYADFVRWRDERGGAAALFYHLLRVDLSEFDPGSPAMKTDAKVAMAAVTRSDVDAWAADLARDPDAFFQSMGVGNPSDLWDAKRMLALYDPARTSRLTSNGMARALHRTGLRQIGGSQGLTRTVDGLRRLYVVKNLDQWLRRKPKDFADHYNTHFGQLGREPNDTKKKRF